VKHDARYSCNDPSHRLMALSEGLCKKGVVACDYKNEELVRFHGISFEMSLDSPRSLKLELKKGERDQRSR
jgi:hypothetical protein